MITIYHVPRTRSARIIWLCEELDLPYEVVAVDFSPEYRKSAEWRRLNPIGKVPALTDLDAEGNPFTMIESGAMVHYILERYGEGRLQRPPGTPESALLLQWSWFAEASLARPLGDMVHHRILKPEPERIPAVVEDGRERAEICLDAVEAALEGRDYLMGGELTAADIMMGYSLALAQRLDVLDDRYPKLLAYMSRLEARPGFRIAFADAERSGPLRD
ncbi:MAG: glutathione S-transferase family protein [Acidobacteria bacterium]|nr:glutathione S-transferase family protein [Acidobacteriota bacterium]MXZ38416.1 glutathione S-transferase family protein [Holophagales bacterium]MYF05620.1 glutathione S-transferase family protein [Holophagales bacterium]MYJ27089.1 glutathione S-transferase family protein [Holophagales bacterium]